jgi:putative N6-adenine-specific DNA methylase
VPAPLLEFEIYCVATPGLEAMLLAEMQDLQFKGAKQVKGGVTAVGAWPEVWRANLQVRGTGRVLVRIGSFHVGHLAQLDKLSHKFPWFQFLRKDVPVRVEATCRKSRIYHAGAAIQRIETAIHEELGATISEDAEVCIKARIENDLCTISIDTSGGMLHKRGHKEAIAKAPLRETIASLLLRAAGFTGRESVLDPMCGSGTFVIEAAEMAAGLYPGRSRSFAFAQLKSFDPEQWATLQKSSPHPPTQKFFGSDRDAGAIKASFANAKRAGVENFVNFQQKSISDLQRPDGEPGLVIVNPPYGTRIGDKRPLFDLHAAFGKIMRERFHGWRVAMITTDAALAKATTLPFKKPLGPINHGGLKISLYCTQPLIKRDKPAAEELAPTVTTELHD